MTELHAHPDANLFPKMNEAEFDSFVADIEANGLIEEIVLHPNGSILDGRNRYEACQRLGITPRYRTWDESGNPVHFVLSMNLHRRHLDASQRAMIAGAVANIEVGEVGGGHPKTDSQICLPEAAAMLNVSQNSTKDAKIVLKDGTPEEIANCKNGDAAVSTTAKKIRARDKPVETPAPPKPTGRMGARITVPEGLTAEQLCRQAMDLESNGASSDSAAKTIGVSPGIYRLMRDIVTLSEIPYLTAWDQAVVATALDDLNENRQVQRNRKTVDPIAKHIWGSRSRGTLSYQDAARRRVESFENACRAVVNICASTSRLDLPYLNQRQLEDADAALEIAAKNIKAFQTKIKRLHKIG